MKPAESYKTHDDELCKPEAQRNVLGGACAVCGAPCERKFCGLACYRTVQRSGSDAERFWAKVSKTDGCWLWTASRSGGRLGKRYGQFSVTVSPGKQRVTGAHIFSYELHHGPVPDGLEVMHTCDNSLCVRGDHLTIGTHTDNMQDASQKGRTHVPRPKGQVVSDAQLVEMVALYKAGMPQNQIADRFGVSKTYVCLLVKGKRRQYSNLNAPAVKRTA